MFLGSVAPDSGDDVRKNKSHECLQSHSHPHRSQAIKGNGHANERDNLRSGRGRKLPLDVQRQARLQVRVCVCVGNNKGTHTPVYGSPWQQLPPFSFLGSGEMERTDERTHDPRPTMMTDEAPARSLAVRAVQYCVLLGEQQGRKSQLRHVPSPFILVWPLLWLLLLP